MPENQSSKDRLKDIVNSIEDGIKNLFESEKYMNYLRTMSRFHNYSVNNVLLIHMQKPDATRCAGFTKWQTGFNRHVKKGEKGITIIAPTPYKKKIEQEKLDPDTNLPMLDENGQIIIEEKEIKIPMFKPVKTFDVSQTEGDPLPELAENLVGDVSNYEVFLEALRRSSPVPIHFEPMQANQDGYFSLTKQQIFIRDDMSEIQTVCAILHETAHAKLHNYEKNEISDNAPMYQEIEIFGIPGLFSNGRIAETDVPSGMFRYDLRGSDRDPGMPATVEETVFVNHAGSFLTAKPLSVPEDGQLFLTEEDGLNFTGSEMTVYQFMAEQKKDQRTEEIEAESIAWSVCAYYGIETSANSFGYLANWSSGKDLKELRASLETISKTSDELINDIDRNYAVIMEERKISQELHEIGTDEPLKEEPLPYLPDPTISAEAMNAYGYTDPDMLPLSKERAMELFERDITVYLLFEGNTEAMAFDKADIELHTGIFGITQDDWTEVKDTVPPMVIEEMTPQKWEQRFVDTSADSFAIYQLNDTELCTELLYMNMEYLAKKNIAVNRNNYNAVYAAPLRYDGTKPQILEALYEKFNLDRPHDFHGHSLSVSDIVALKQDGVVSYHYVDSVGFRELPEFGQTAVKCGEKVKSKPKKRPSVLAQLRDPNLKSKSEQQKPMKTAERER